jgi:hypothetical protein
MLAMQVGKWKKKSGHEFNDTATTLLVAMFGGACWPGGAWVFGKGCPCHG